MKDSEKFEVILSEGIKINIDPSDPDKLFHDVVMLVLIPFYEKSNDWNQSIRTALNEISSLRMRYGDKMPKNLDYSKLLLKEVEKKLGHEIDKIKGVDKIEILFLNLDDYTEEIHKLMEGDFSKEERVRVLGDLIAGLNSFEMAELLNHYIKKSRKGN